MAIAPAVTPGSPVARTADGWPATGMVDAILTNTLLPALSAEFLTRMSDGRPVERVHIGAGRSSRDSALIDGPALKRSR